MPLLIAYLVVFVLHVMGLYWRYGDDNLYYPFYMILPKTIRSFWHAIFINLINDTMVLQAGMSMKLILLIVFTQCKSHNFRRHGQMLTVAEYTLQLYREFLYISVWYSFLNKEYGSVFWLLPKDWYLLFTLRSIWKKVLSLFSALRALSKKLIHYGPYATLEQVNVAGDLCAICHEKMHAPVLLSCNHIFCEDCVSEWFERRGTCPICRILVRPGDLQSFGDGSTSLGF